MISDLEIEQELAPLRPLGYAQVPLEGVWRSPPFEDLRFEQRRLAILCDDRPIALLGVDRESGEVVTGEAEIGFSRVNLTLARFVACSRLYAGSAEAFGDEDLDDDGRSALAARLLERLRHTDAEAVADENQLWAVAAEELGYGL